MTDATNQLERFEHNLDTHGADLDQWPEAEREAGLQALRMSEEARTAHAEALRLADVLLQIDPVAREPVEPSAALSRILAEIPSRHPRRKPGEGIGWWPFATIHKPVLALAAAAVLGVVAGSVTHENWSGEPDMPGWALVDGETGWALVDGESSGELAWTPQDVEELSALAFGLELEESWTGEVSP